MIWQMTVGLSQCSCTTKLLVGFLQCAKVHCYFWTQEKPYNVAAVYPQVKFAKLYVLPSYNTQIISVRMKLQPVNSQTIIYTAAICYHLS